jgi:hypothetical protein
MDIEAYIDHFRSGAQGASEDYDEFGLAHTRKCAEKMRREPDGTTPYGDGYCIRVAELTRNPPERN